MQRFCLLKINKKAGMDIWKTMCKTLAREFGKLLLTLLRTLPMNDKVFKEHLGVNST